MPNHVTTRCVVFGSESETQRFRDRAFLSQENSLAFDFNAFIPMPEILSETVAGTLAEEGAILLSHSRQISASESGHHFHRPANSSSPTRTYARRP